MGNGLYGCNQGNESRAAGKGNEAVCMEERIADNEIAEGDLVDQIAFFWNCGLFDSIDNFMADLRHKWTAGYDPEEDKDYLNRVEGRLASILTRGTVGEPATQTVNLKEGAAIPASKVRGKNGKERAPEPRLAEGIKVRVEKQPKPRKLTRAAVLQGVKSGEYTTEQAAEMLEHAK